jgi:hypothetical protein
LAANLKDATSSLRAIDLSTDKYQTHGNKKEPDIIISSGLAQGKESFNSLLEEFEKILNEIDEIKYKTGIAQLSALKEKIDKFKIHLDDVSSLMESENDKLSGSQDSDLPEGTRQILMVSNHKIICANYRHSSADPVPKSTIVIELRGYASPSSHQSLTKAFIIFVNDTEKVLVPTYNKSRGEIKLWSHYRNLNAVLQQINEKAVYCWIGRFGNGHIYGDVHTSHI